MALGSPLSWLADRTSRYPFRIAGGLAALGGSVATYLGVGGTATPAELGSFVGAHPAYPAAVVVGIGALLFYDG